MISPVPQGPASQGAASLAPGTLFHQKYRIVRCLGQGGMGSVYEVIHTGTERRRALKVMLPLLVADPYARERFAQEARVTAAVESPHVVETIDAGVDGATGCPFIVMELLRGQDLYARIEKGAALTPAELCEVMRQTARGLDEMHAAGVIHRDLKPDNLFSTEQRDGSRVIKILDFGIAKIAEAASASRNTSNVGTPMYMAPEQFDGQRLDHRADLYALGHIAFELLTREHYWGPEIARLPNGLALIRAIDKGLPEPASVRAARLGVALGPEFDAWFARATARDPAARFPTASAQVRELEWALSAGANQNAFAVPSVASVRETGTPTIERPTLRRPAGPSPAEPAAASAIDRLTDAPTSRRPVPVVKSQQPSSLRLAAIGGGLAALVFGLALLAWPRSPAPERAPPSAAPSESATAASTTRVAVTPGADSAASAPAPSASASASAKVKPTSPTAGPRRKDCMRDGRWICRD